MVMSKSLNLLFDAGDIKNMLRTANTATNIEAEEHAQPHEGISILLILYFVIYLLRQKSFICRTNNFFFFLNYIRTSTYIYNA